MGRHRSECGDDLVYSYSGAGGSIPDLTACVKQNGRFGVLGKPSREFRIRKSWWNDSKVDDAVR